MRGGLETNTINFHAIGITKTEEWDILGISQCCWREE